MAQSQPSHEARIRALENAVGGSSGRSSTEIVPLKEHFEARVAALEKATVVASTAMERRLDGMNEFRDTLRDQAARFVTRDEVGLQLKALCAEVEELKRFRAVVDAKASMSAVYVSYLLAAIGIILSVLSLLGVD